MLRSFDTSVLIVGAGPVGLTLAMELASRGVDVTVTETRRAGEPPNVKCNQVSARSMEIFRRLGLADRIRNTGLPPEAREPTEPQLSCASGSQARAVAGPVGLNGAALGCIYFAECEVAYTPSRFPL